MKAFDSGPIAGASLSPEELSWAKQRFYELMHWDPKTGSPTDACIMELELSELLAQCKYNYRVSSEK